LAHCIALKDTPQCSLEERFFLTITGVFMRSTNRLTVQKTFPSADRKLTACLAVMTVASASACKPRLFNDSQTASAGSAAAALSTSVEAQAESLIPFWPVPASAGEISQLPSPAALGFSTGAWNTVLEQAFSETDANGRKKQLTLSNPECARSPDSWRVTAARLAPFEVDLPGSIASWQTLALQRETDFAQRVQLHVTIQAWCSSPRLGRSDFLHTLDHAFLLTFDLSTSALPKTTLKWLEETMTKSLNSETVVLRSDNKILPYARFLRDLHDSSAGRKGILKEWNRALKTEELMQKKNLPSSNWLSMRQSVPLNQGLTSIAVSHLNPAHPALQASPSALNSFFGRFATEKNLIRIRAHITEGLGTSQRFLRWDRQAEKLVPSALQTVAAQWDRVANTMTLSPQLTNAPRNLKAGDEQTIIAEQRAQLLNVDHELTPLAGDLSLQDLLSLGEKTSDPDRTSVHSTRCVSCHGLDDALRMARNGRPASQRGINPAQLTLFGLSADARPVINTRTLRAAEADAIRIEEDDNHDKRSSKR
jgi:hypothetical protein